MPVDGVLEPDLRLHEEPVPHRAHRRRVLGGRGVRHLRRGLVLPAEVEAERDLVQTNDPARAARIIVEVVGSADPPRRLLLGAGAVAQARDAATQRAAELEQWADLSATADFPQQRVSAA